MDKFANLSYVLHLTFLVLLLIFLIQASIIFCSRLDKAKLCAYYLSKY